MASGNRADTLKDAIHFYYQRVAIKMLIKKLLTIDAQIGVAKSTLDSNQDKLTRGEIKDLWVQEQSLRGVATSPKAQDN
jgi:hypothetical protein